MSDTTTVRDVLGISELYVGHDPSTDVTGYPGEGVDCLLTVWADGTREFAVRPGHERRDRTWGPPASLVLEPVSMSDLRETIRAIISTAYYDNRNDGRTMESAADDASDRVMALLAERTVGVKA